MKTKTGRMVVLCAGLLLLLSGTATAVDRTWTGSSANNLWTTSGNWNTVPGAGDQVYVDTTGNDPLVNMDVATLYSNVYFGVNGAAEVVLAMQSGGYLRTDSSGYIVFGESAGTSARCEMSGGTLSSRQVRIGNSGTGTMNLSGGSIAASDWVGVGANTGGIGVLNMTGGSMNAYNLTAGHSGQGTIDISGGTVAATNWIGIAKYSNAGGSVLVLRDTGNIATHHLSIGLGGNGVFNITGGSFNLTGTDGRIRMGEGTGAGAWNISGGTAAVSGYIYMGYSTGSTGANTITVTSGDLSTGRIYAGYNATGDLDISGGTVTVGDWVGVGTGSAGSGTVALSGTGNLETFKMSVGLAGDGVFNMSGGTLTLDNKSNARLRIGEGAATGTWNMDGGTAVVPYYVSIGHSSGAGTDAMNMSDGSVDTGAFVVGLNGDGIFNMTGGNLHVDDGYFGAGNLRLGEGAGSGTWNMEDGLVVVTKSVQLGYGTSGGDMNLLTMTGGEVRADNLEIGRYGDGKVDLLGGIFYVDGIATNGLMFDTHGGDGQLNLEGGVLRWLNGDYTAEINASIASNNIVAYNGSDSVKVSYDANSNSTTIEAASASYSQWATSYELSGGDAETTADPDGDGFDNLLEYGLGGDPTDPADQGIPPTYGFSEGWMIYVYPKRAAENSGLSYHLELIDDLAYGTWIDSGYDVLGTGTIDSQFDAVTNRVSTEIESERFIRLVIEQL